MQFPNCMNEDNSVVDKNDKIYKFHLVFAYLLEKLKYYKPQWNPLLEQRRINIKDALSNR